MYKGNLVFIVAAKNVIDELESLAEDIASVMDSVFKHVQDASIQKVFKNCLVFYYSTRFIVSVNTHYKCRKSSHLPQIV